jgi:large subunit ribosomal protein L17
MRHLKTGRKLNRTSSHRKALFRNLAAALFHHESIKTTNPKALELRRVADGLISLAKSNTAHAIRRAFAYLRDKEAVKKLFADIGTRYAEVKGGYTRVLKIGPRKGDAAPMAIIELTRKKDELEQEKEQKKKPKKEVKKAPKKAEKKEEKEDKKGKKEKKGKEGKAGKEEKEGKKEKKGVKKEAKAVKEKTPRQEGRKKQAKQEQGD